MYRLSVAYRPHPLVGIGPPAFWIASSPSLASSIEKASRSFRCVNSASVSFRMGMLLNSVGALLRISKSPGAVSQRGFERMLENRARMALMG
jgi:hypothetical protein